MIRGGPLGTVCINDLSQAVLGKNYNQLTILSSDHNDGCCRSSSNTSVSCDATGVVGVWQESIQCSYGL